MWSAQNSARFLPVLLLLAAASVPSVRAADKLPALPIVKVAGILIDKTDKLLTVKANGEEVAVKYVVPGDADKKLTKTLKNIFNASRVQLTYKTVGNERQLVSLKKQVLKATGTITAMVVKVHNDFWSKSNRNPPRRRLCSRANFNTRTHGETCGLKPGDSVTIKYYTDFERHRIETLKKNEDGGDKKAPEKRTRRAKRKRRESRRPISISGQTVRLAEPRQTRRRAIPSGRLAGRSSRRGSRRRCRGGDAQFQQNSTPLMLTEQNPDSLELRDFRRFPQHVSIAANFEDDCVRAPAVWSLTPLPVKVLYCPFN